MNNAATIEERVHSDAGDTVLADQFAAGESGAFERLVTLYQPGVTRLAYRLLGWRADVDDVVQDVFLTAMTKARTFQVKSSLWTWLTVITLNRCRTQMRRAAVFQRIKAMLGGRATDEAPAADSDPARDETNQRVRSAVAALGGQDREVVVLFYLEQRPVSEISEMLGVSPNSVHVRLHRARGKLRSSLRQFATE